MHSIDMKRSSPDELSDLEVFKQQKKYSSQHATLGRSQFGMEEQSGSMFGEGVNVIKAGRSQTSRNHVITEQRRRNKINQGFEALKGLVPGTSKLDKAGLLSATVDYIQQTQSLLKELAIVGSQSNLPEDLQVRVQQLIPNQVPVVVVHSTGMKVGDMKAGDMPQRCTVTAIPANTHVPMGAQPPVDQIPSQPPSAIGGQLSKLLEMAFASGAHSQQPIADLSPGRASDCDTYMTISPTPDIATTNIPQNPSLLQASSPEQQMLQALAAIAWSSSAQSDGIVMNAQNGLSQAAPPSSTHNLPPPLPLQTQSTYMPAPIVSSATSAPSPQTQMALLSLLLNHQLPGALGSLFS